jgi:hypothetical protein
MAAAAEVSRFTSDSTLSNQVVPRFRSRETWQILRATSSEICHFGGIFRRTPAAILNVSPAKKQRLRRVSLRGRHLSPVVFYIFEANVL